MSTASTLGLSDDVVEYIDAFHAAVADPAVDALVAATRELGWVSRMQVTPGQARLLTMLTTIMRARVAVDIGTFTGLSALAIARGLGPGGRITTFDTDARWGALARRAWEQDGVADRIDARDGDGVAGLAALNEGSVDLIFLDADKECYPRCYDLAVTALAPGGVLVVDNTLWFGRVADRSIDDDEVRAIRTLNERAAIDPRVDAVIVPIADGMTICRRLVDASSTPPQPS